ncbi:MAG: DUF305 domain-containing protein [Dehalococcoidia bacterium]
MNPVSQRYVRFGTILVASLLIMFALSMSMVRRWGDFYWNLSNFYMALTMVSAMSAVMTVGMWHMLGDVRVNAVWLGASLVMFVAAFFMGRSETAVGNEEFLRSMIPHHSRAILVCQESHLTDPEIIELCEGIVSSQQEEIDQMKAILGRY